jgi:hypothetical protein
MITVKSLDIIYPIFYLHEFTQSTNLLKICLTIKKCTAVKIISEIEVAIAAPRIPYIGIKIIFIIMLSMAENKAIL